MEFGTTCHEDPNLAPVGLSTEAAWSDEAPVMPDIADGSDLTVWQEPDPCPAPVESDKVKASEKTKADFHRHAHVAKNSPQ
jgi:hypothetical protein